MNKIFTLAVPAVCLILLTTAPAVPGQTAEKLANAEAVAKQLNLTPQQEAKVLPILKEEGPKVEQIKNNPSLSGIQKMKELRAIHSQTAPQLSKFFPLSNIRSCRQSASSGLRKRWRQRELATDSRCAPVGGRGQLHSCTVSDFPATTGAVPRLRSAHRCSTT